MDYLRRYLPVAFFAFFILFQTAAEDFYYTVKNKTRPVVIHFFQDYLYPGDRIIPAFKEQRIDVGGINVGYYRDFPDTDIIALVIADDLYIEGSGSFDSDIVYKETGREIAGAWYPLYYIDALEKDAPDGILVHESHVPEIEKREPHRVYFAASFWFHDLVILINTPLIQGYSAFHITHLDNHGNGIYKAQILSNIVSKFGFTGADLKNIIDMERYTLYIHHSNNRLRIYLDGEEKPQWNLFNASYEFSLLLRGFHKEGHWPGDKDYKSYLAPDIFEPWPVLPLSDLKNIIDKKPVDTISHRLTSNLRLRSRPGTSAAIVDTLPEGSGVYVLRTGDSATIDGITAPWVYVAAQNGNQGWCFSGYLEEIKEEPNPAAAAQDALPEAQTDGEAESGTIPPAALIGGGTGILVLAALFALIRRKKKA
jgi:hypothetical protein